MLVAFDDDTLDQNDQLVAALGARATGEPRPPEVMTRPGNHLTPVVLSLTPPEGLSLGGRLPRSVGDEADARTLGADIAAWLTRPA
jgi:hypothetical protein